MNHDPVFGCVVLVVILDCQAFLSIVISFTLSSFSKLHSVYLEIGFILDTFNKPHPAEQSAQGVGVGVGIGRGLKPKLRHSK